MSAPAHVRAAAARIVTQVARHGRSLDALLASAPRFEGSDAALLRLLTSGTVRWYIRLRALLGELLAKPTRTLEPDVESLLLVGLYQQLDTDVAPHAAVSETVEAVRSLGRPRAAPLVNAVLRRAQREARSLLVSIDSEPALRTAHPPWLVERLERTWGSELEVLLDANNEPPPLWLRVNLRRTSLTECALRLETAGHEVSRSLHAPEALRLGRPLDVRRLPEFQQGLVSVQDAAAQLAAHLLGASPGDRVLDACAAPGGKTCHILELQSELAGLVAVDSSAARLERIRENLTRLALSAELQVADVARPQDWWDGRPFDRILLDVPCSATGVIRRHPDVKLLRRPDDIAALTTRQRAMLDAVWPLLAPGGRLVYASCSALREENVEVVETFLAGATTARDVTPRLAPFAPAPTGLAIRAGAAGMDGFYYACLEKANG